MLGILAVEAMNGQNPAPAGPQKERILVLNGYAHPGNGKVIPNSAIGFEKGKLTLVADATTIRIDRTQYDTVIDAHGKQIYPGIIDCNSYLGLAELDLVRATLDYHETGLMNPNVRSIVAYNTDSRIIPTVRSNGVLLAQVVPQGGLVSGSSSVVVLDAWNWEDASYKTDEGIHVNWPGMYVYRSDNPEKEKEQRDRMEKNLLVLDQLFSDAKAYSLDPAPREENLRLESMKGLFNGSKKLYVHCGYIKEIVSAVAFCNRYGIKMVLVGGEDSWRVTGLLKDNQIPVILDNVHSLPSRDDEDVDLPYKRPFLLKQAGVEFAIGMNGTWNIRNEIFWAGTAVEYGLAPEDAVASITSIPAKILGIDDRTGTLETGKDATLIISEGDLLDMRSSKIISAFIQGRNINLDDMQKQLYRKYMTKYGLDSK